MHLGWPCIDATRSRQVTVTLLNMFCLHVGQCDPQEVRGWAGQKRAVAGGGPRAAGCRGCAGSVLCSCPHVVTRKMSQGTGTAHRATCVAAQARNEQMLELEHALLAAEDALMQRQAALVECQDMLAEMQGFSEAQRHRADREQAQAQVRAVPLPQSTEHRHQYSSHMHAYQ